MRHRCDLDRPEFIKYKELGISYCEEWSNFDCFADWAISKEYKEGLSLDRIDPLLDYFPENCRLVTRTVQARNVRKDSSKYKYLGVRKAPDSDRYIGYLTVDYKQVRMPRQDTEIEAAILRDKYILENGLNHTLNILTRK